MVDFKDDISVILCTIQYVSVESPTTLNFPIILMLSVSQCQEWVQSLHRRETCEAHQGQVSVSASRWEDWSGDQLQLHLQGLPGLSAARWQQGLGEEEDTHTVPWALQREQ